MLYFLSTILAIVTLLVMAIFMFLHGKSRLDLRIWGYICIGVMFWQIGSMGFSTTSSKEMAFYWWQFAHIGAMLVPPIFFHFICIYLKLKKKILINSAYLFSITFIFINFLFGENFIGGLRITPDNFYWIDWFHRRNILFIIYYLIIYIGLLGYAYILLLKAFKTSAGIKHKQIQYLIFGTAVAWSGPIGVIVSYFRINLYRYTNILMGLFPLIIGYAIVAYNLLDIKVVITSVTIFTAVYTLVLGIPLGLAGWGKFWLQGFFGINWYWAPLIVAIFLATFGPFIYFYLQRRAENILLKDQRRYQVALADLSKKMGRIRSIDKLIEAIVFTIATAVRVSFISVYLKNDEYKTFLFKGWSPENVKLKFQDSVTFDDLIIKLLYKKKRPFFSDDTGILKNFCPDAAMIVPCFLENELFCFIVLGDKLNKQFYTQDDIASFELFSYSAALAIENSIFWEEIQERQRQERVSEMDIYSYSLAHEIDNPMQVIMGSYYNLKPRIEKIQMPEEEKDSMMRSLDFMNEAANRVTGMVEAIRSFGSRSSGELEVLSLKKVIESFARLYMPQLKAEKVVLIKEIPDNDIFVRGDKNELITIFINFAKNAIHAMEFSREKKLIIRVFAPNPDITRISFTDTGHGIPHEKIKTIFAPFVTTKASTVGTGMGLYNVVKMAAHNKGKVWAESGGDKMGATFVLELPLAKDNKLTEPDGGHKKRNKWRF